jgi:predicted MFS family arabinose efflux permease
LLAGAVADRLGFRQTLRAAFLVQAAAIALVAASDGPIALLVSSIVVGALVPGVAPLALGRVNELVREARARQAAWSWCTTAFAVGQATGRYLFSYLFARTDAAYALLFALGATAMLGAFLVDCMPGADRPRHWREEDG